MNINYKLKPCVIGLGYVGLPVFLQLSKKFKTIGYDVKKHRINFLKKKIDYNNEFSKKELNLKNNSFFTSNKNELKNSNFYIITVPTPIFKNKAPNLNFIINAAKLIKKYIKDGDIIFLESTVYPGTTIEICSKIILEKKGGKPVKNFNIGYSSERINPGDKNHTIYNIKKVVAFKEKNHEEKGKVLKIYKTISKKIIYTNYIREAELSKLIENTQRDINIAFINEIKVFCDKLNLDFKETYRLASSKWNFLKFNSGLVGGHCLPVDPYYLSYVARKNNINTFLTLAGRKINEKMVNFNFKKIQQKLNFYNIGKNSNLLVAGMSYKENTSDLRNSLSLKIYKLIKKKYKNTIGYEPNLFEKDKKKFKIENNIQDFKKYKCVVFLINHKVFNKLYKILKKQKTKIIKIF